MVAVALSNGVNVTKSSTAKDACEDALVVAATIVPDSGKEKKEKKDKNKESVISKKRSAVEPVAILIGVVAVPQIGHTLEHYCRPAISRNSKRIEIGRGMAVRMDHPGREAAKFGLLRQG